MGGFGDFSKRMDTLALAIEPRAANVLRKVALAADQTFVLATPVDTGRARSNWQASTGTPILAEREAFVPGSGGSSEAANSQAAIDQAKAAITGHQIGAPIFVSNNVQYINELNDGTSKQASPGFIERGIQAAVNEINRESDGFVSVRRLT